MAHLFEEVSTITAKGQTTVPKAVRQALGVDYGGRIAFRVSETGVSVVRADDEESDPVIEAFLAFLARDMERHPERIRPLDPALMALVDELTEGINVDLDAPIEGDVDL